MEEMLGHKMSALKNTIAIVIALFALGAGSSAITHAQLADDGRVSIRISPDMPSPLEKVTVTLVSNSVDLDRAVISWSLNGKKALSGTGEKIFSFLAGNAGESKRVNVTVKTPSGEIITKSTAVSPGEISLFWEAIDSYVPPFYKGKALPSSETNIRVVALPNIKNGGVLVKPENLIYMWKRNNNVIPGSSGYGKNTFVFKAGFQFANEKIDVFAETIDGAVAAHSQTIITVGEPVVRLYENRPLEGVYYERTIPERIVLDTGEIATVAEPYFFSAAGGTKKGLIFTWLLNEKEVPGMETDPGSVILRAPNGVEGVAELVSVVRHQKKVLQEKEARVLIKFGKTQ